MNTFKKISICFLLVRILLLVSGCSGHNQPLSRKIKFAPEEQKDVINAMTFNVRVDTALDVFNRWKQRRNAVMNLIEKNSPDIMALQETLHFQVEDISEAFPQYTSYSAGRKDGFKKGEACPIFFRTDRFTLLDMGTFWFSNTPNKPGSKSFGNIWPRLCTWAHLTDIETEKSFYVYNLHLACMSQKSRRESVKQLTKHIAQRKTDEPVVVLGDFNMELNNPAMKYLANNPFQILRDAWQALNPNKKAVGTMHHFTGKSTGPRIDHIPLSENAHALEVRTDKSSLNGKYPSDHFPVIAKIKLEKRT